MQDQRLISIHKQERGRVGTTIYDLRTSFLSLVSSAVNRMPLPGWQRAVFMAIRKTTAYTDLSVSSSGETFELKWCNIKTKTLLHKQMKILSASSFDLER